MPTLKSAPSQPCLPSKFLPLAAGGRLHTQITLRSLVPHMAHPSLSHHRCLCSRSAQLFGSAAACGEGSFWTGATPGGQGESTEDEEGSSLPRGILALSTQHGAWEGLQEETAVRPGGHMPTELDCSEWAPPDSHVADCPPWAGGKVWSWQSAA